ncbi:MAG: polysaccharide biosynthesis/export family protein [bacterium]
MNGSRLFRMGLTILFIFEGAGDVTAELYRIQINDVLEVTVWNHPELSKEVVVPVDGHISYPLVGDISVVGLTVAQLEQTLRNGLAQYLVEPKVSVLLTQFKKRVIHVIGAVKKPGTFDYVEGKTLIDYLGLAGGPTDRGNMKRVTVSRRDTTNIRSIEIDVNRILRGGLRELDIELYPDDTVLVPESFISGWRDWATLGSLVIGSLTLYVLAKRWLRD